MEAVKGVEERYMKAIGRVKVRKLENWKGGQGGTGGKHLGRQKIKNRELK